jgi:transposase
MNMFLTDEQWKVLKPVLDPPQAPRRGRPWKDGRAVLEAIFFILHTGLQWEHLPRSFPPKSTVPDRRQLWSANQAFCKLLAKVVRSLAQKGRIDLDQCFIDATFAPAKGGGEGVGLTKKGKGTKLQLIVDGQGLPVGASVAAANVAEWHMVQQTLDLFSAKTQPERLIERQGLRLRRTGRNPRRTGSGNDGATPQKSTPGERHAGRSSSAPLPASLDRRTNLCLARSTPPPVGALGEESD